MQISEIFYSLQGEGISLGKPVVFVRLSGCHLRCVWCDTKYTWPLSSGEKMTLAEIVKEIKKFPAKHIVITGGEPLLQQDELKKLLEKLPGYYVEMETSGDIKPTLGKLIDHYNCSPKLSSAKNQNFSLKKFPKSKTWYKFVIDNEAELKEVKKMMKDHNIDKDRVILMPQGIDTKELSERSKWLAEICKKENFRFSPRMHIYIWGNTLGT